MQVFVGGCVFICAYACVCLCVGVARFFVSSKHSASLFCETGPNPQTMFSLRSLVAITISVKLCQTFSAVSYLLTKGLCPVASVKHWWQMMQNVCTFLELLDIYAHVLV